MGYMSDPSMVLHKRGGEAVYYEEVNTDVLDAASTYTGYITREGNWIIIKKVTADSVMTATFAKGASGYSTAWTNRATQTYGAYTTLF